MYSPSPSLMHSFFVPQGHSAYIISGTDNIYTSCPRYPVANFDGTPAWLLLLLRPFVPDRVWDAVTIMSKFAQP
jgi:hypothetical protein